MWETIWVQGTEYPKDHKNYPAHSSMPGGPLVMYNGAWIGWKCVGLTKPDLFPDGSPRVRLSHVLGKDGEMERAHAPIMYKWVYDPTPVQVVLKSGAGHIRKAVRAGDLRQITTAQAKKLLKGGE